MSTAITPTPVPTTQPGLVARSESRAAKVGGSGTVAEGPGDVVGTGAAWEAAWDVGGAVRGAALWPITSRRICCHRSGGRSGARPFAGAMMLCQSQLPAVG